MVKMERIAVSGGKGGTGKSTFAILFALKMLNLGKKVVLCDCDVECPNDHLLLDQKLERSKPIYQLFPKLDKRKCKKCGLCSRVCRKNAVFWVKGKYPIFMKDLCISCGACWKFCPNGAIKPEKEKIGEYFITKVKKNFWLVTGRSKPGVSETGLVVKETKKIATKVAERVGADYLIIDTAPGTHCNVIHALMGCEKVYLITEPTPLGAQSLKTILELVRKMKLKAEIVLNKATIGRKKEVERIAKKFGKKICVEIPYSEKLLRAYSRGRLEEVVDLI